MTVIIWLKHNKKNYLAADCRATAWYSLVQDNTNKIIAHNNCLIWAAWWVIESGLLKKVLSQNKDLKIESELDIIDIYLMLRTVCKDHNLLEMWDEPCIECIFVTDKHIWKLYSDGWVLEFDDYCACGCWEDFALWLLQLTTIKNPEKDLKNIVKTVSKLSLWVWPNVTIKVAVSDNDIQKIIKKVTTTKPKKKKINNIDKNKKKISKKK